MFGFVYVMYACMYTVVKKRIPAIFSNKFNNYWSISEIFGRENLQSLQCSNMLLENFATGNMGNQ